MPEPAGTTKIHTGIRMMTQVPVTLWAAEVQHAPTELVFQGFLWSRVGLNTSSAVRPA